MEKCFADKKKAKTELDSIVKVGSCCYNAVVGIETAGKKVPNQMCNSDADCFTGKCNIPTTSSTTTVTVSATTKSCFKSDEYDGKKYFCSSVDGPAAGAPIATCFQKKLTAINPKLGPVLASHFAKGNQSATMSQVGAGIWAASSDPTCVGESGYMYNPRDW